MSTEKPDGDMWYNRDMRSFGELLSEYTQRAGITDAELARSIGVQRQTIFRWKEGLVARPRYREDVLKISQKLRLTTAERDELLLASGFPPDEQTGIPRDGDAPPGASADRNAPGASEDESTLLGDQDSPAAAVATQTGAPRERRSRTGWLLGLALLIASVAIGIGVVWLPRVLPQRMKATPTPGVATPAPAASNTPTMAPSTATPVVATAGEKLVLIAPFVGYTSSELRFNVAGRIQETLDTEIADLELTDARVVVLDAPIASQGQAELTLQDTGASAVIWGEYDAGRVRANVSVSSHDDKAWVNPVDSPDKLPVIINEQVPDAVRLLALFALGRLYRDSGDHAHALQVFEQSLALNPEDRTMQAALHFYIGAILPEVKGYRTDVLTASIEHYNQALTLEPTWENILYNRGTTYLGRGLLSPNERADLDQAITDLTEVIRLQPKRVEPYLNRGIAYYQRNAEGDQAAAIADLTHAVELQPRDDRAFYHRGLAEIRNGAAVGIWQSDLEQAQELNPTNPAIANGLCWGHAVAADAEAGLEFCEQAVAADKTGSSLDGRAIVYARLGRYDEAANDLRNYLKWVKATYPQLYTKYRGPAVETWIAALEKGENPFTPETLALLRAG